MSSLAAVLFDMDGTLVDTECLWWEAVADVAASIGRPLAPHDKPAVTGRPVAYTASYLLATSESHLGPEALEHCLEKAFTSRVRARIQPRPGVPALLESLADKAIPAAIVSASPRSVVDLVAASLGSHFFASTVSVEDTERTKPHPDPYQHALAILGVAPGCCVAVEDTAVGARAAEAAGLHVLFVPSEGLQIEGPQIEGSNRRTMRRSLKGLDAASLGALLS